MFEGGETAWRSQISDPSLLPSKVRREMRSFPWISLTYSALCVFHSHNNDGNEYGPREGCVDHGPLRESCSIPVAMGSPSLRR